MIGEGGWGVGLRHAAACPHLRLLLLYWLFQFEERRVTAGRREEDCAAVGGDQRHAGVLTVGSGIAERVRGAVAQVTVEQGVIQQFGGGPLLLELRQSLSALFRPGVLLGGLRADDPAVLGRRRVAIRGWLRRHGGQGGDEAVLFAAVIFEDGGHLGLIWLLHWLDLREINKDYFNPSQSLLLRMIKYIKPPRGEDQSCLIWCLRYHSPIKCNAKEYVDD